MILERSMTDGRLSNTYLVAAHEAGPAFYVDAGGPVEPLLEAAARHGLKPSHVLLTHHHDGHVAELGKLLEAHPGIEVLAHPSERDLVPGVTGTIDDGDTVRIGALDVRVLHTPGHTDGALAFIAGRNVFTGDTLLKGAVGASDGQLKRSVMAQLMTLDPQTIIRPGHAEPSTVGEEWSENPVIRGWRGLDGDRD